MQTARIKKEELHFRGLSANSTAKMRGEASSEIVIEVTLGYHRLKMLKVVLIVEDADMENQQERGSYMHATSESEKEGK